MSHNRILEELGRVLGESRVAAPSGWINPVVEEDESKSKGAIEALRDTDYKDQDAHFKMVQLLKGLAAAEDDLSGKFLSAVSDALTASAKKVLGGKSESVDHEMTGADPEQYDGEDDATPGAWLQDAEAATDVIQDISQAFVEPEERELAVDTITALDQAVGALKKDAGDEGGTGTDDADPSQTEGVQQGELPGVPELSAATKDVLDHLHKFQDVEQAFQDPQEREELRKKLDALSRAVKGAAGEGDLV